MNIKMYVIAAAGAEYLIDTRRNSHFDTCAFLHLMLSLFVNNVVLFFFALHPAILNKICLFTFFTRTPHAAADSMDALNATANGCRHCSVHRNSERKRFFYLKVSFSMTSLEIPHKCSQNPSINSEFT